MSNTDRNFLDKLGICPIWLINSDLSCLKKCLCEFNISSVDAENVRMVRRRLQLKKYRLESYNRSRDLMDKLLEEKKGLESEVKSLLSEIEKLKKEIAH